MEHWQDDEADASGEEYTGIRVLVVGDDEPFLHRIAELFRVAGRRSREVYDPRSAIARVGGGHADVVVCDLGASRLQAIATVLALRSLGDDAPPVIVVSSMPNLAQHCHALKVQHFIAQPFRFLRLLELADRLGERYRATPSERSGVFLRQQAEDMLDDLPDLDALNFG